MSQINKVLSTIHKDIRCAKCGRTYPETLLNIEAVIHHGAKEYVCIDTKVCRKKASKKPNKNKQNDNRTR